MGKAVVTKRILWASILIFGSLSLADGYLKVPGMEKLDTPYDHLFRGGNGPPNMNDWDDDEPPTMKQNQGLKLPQMHSFYHKMEGPSQMYEPMGQVFFSHRPSGRLYLPATGYYNNMSPFTRLSGLKGTADEHSDNLSHIPGLPGLKKTTGYSYNISPMTEISGTEREIAGYSIAPITKPSSLVQEPAGNSERISDGEQRVVGGRDVSDGEIPWQVSLQRKSMKSGRIFHICGGSIINREWVVTAAHCVALALLSNYRVVSATTNLRDENRVKGFHSQDYYTHKVVDVHIHDSYDMFRFRNDIALIRVEPPFQFSNKVQAISLPSPGHTAHGMAYASGWGLTQEGVRVTPSRLKAVTLPIVSDSECRKAYGDNLQETMICAGYKEGGKSVCQGDSGGPLFQDHGGQSVLIGVVSWGVGCARPGKPGVYTEVSHYIGWIDDIVGGAARQNLVR